MPSLIDIDIKGLRMFKNSHLYINFRNEKRVFGDEIEEHVVTPIAGSNYLNNVLVFAGINASGKTTSLKIINFILEVFILGKSLNENTDLNDLFSESMNITIHIQQNNKLYKVKSTISKDLNSQPTYLFFKHEEVIVKKVTQQMSQKNLLEFSSDLEIMTRNNLPKEQVRFLKNDDSILPTAHLDFENSSLTMKQKQLYISHTFDTTNMNYLSAFPEEAIDIIQYLDERIEDFQLIDDSEETHEKLYTSNSKFRLKFFDQEAQIIPFDELSEYLSSGTIKGLSVLTKVLFALKTGGYLIIDELENHFNRSIVENIINFFQSEINQNGATLLFSTHYSELLDTVKRRDAIKLLHTKEKKLNIDSLSELANTKNKDRSDIKNSDLILSGIFGTAPSYERYIKLRKEFKNIISGGEYN